LGKIFDEGLGVAKDSHEALKWHVVLLQMATAAQAAMKRLGCWLSCLPSYILVIS
jgi:TPR repeat protein